MSFPSIPPVAANGNLYIKKIKKLKDLSALSFIFQEHDFNLATDYAVHRNKK